MEETTAKSPAMLAIRGGPKATPENPGKLFDWPIVTAEDEQAVLEVLRQGAMSGTDVTKKFEAEFAEWQGSRYALGFNNGTAAVHGALFGCRVGVGDEVIGPSLTYWASAVPCYSLGATVVFADIDPDTLCIDPNDIEHRISERTKAIMVVHYAGHPADMDPIMEIARRHGLKVIEDVSHAQGGLYKGRAVGTIGDVGAMSLMSGKSLPAGEAGMLVTNDREIYDRACAFGHHERFRADNIVTEELLPFAGLPLGGHKYRMNQLSSAMGRVQLKHYDARCDEIRSAINRFWDLLEGVPGLRSHRTDPSSDSNMAGWYAARGHYRPEELGGLSVTRFVEALRAEGVKCKPGANKPLHLHPLFNDCDVYGHGKPTRMAYVDADLRQPAGSLPFTEAAGSRLYTIPWFKHDEPDLIEQYAGAYRKVAENHEELLADDPGDPPDLGSWHFFNV